MSSTRPPPIISPSARAEEAISSLVTTAIKTGTVISAASSMVIRRREPRRQAASALRSERVRYFVPGADREKTRDGDFGDLLDGHQAPRAAQAGRERLAVGTGLVGEGAKGPSDRIGHIVKTRGHYG